MQITPIYLNYHFSKLVINESNSSEVGLGDRENETTWPVLLLMETSSIRHSFK